MALNIQFLDAVIRATRIPSGTYSDHDKKALIERVLQDIKERGEGYDPKVFLSACDRTVSGQYLAQLTQSSEKGELEQQLADFARELKDAVQCKALPTMNFSNIQMRIDNIPGGKNREEKGRIYASKVEELLALIGCPDFLNESYAKALYDVLEIDLQDGKEKIKYHHIRDFLVNKLSEYLEWKARK